ncbi:hypothetical protein ACFLWS_03140 [Chloroflexota bacterium]
MHCDISFSSRSSHQKERETKRAEKRAAEDIEQLAREQAIAEAQGARKLSAKKQTREKAKMVFGREMSGLLDSF